MIHVESEVAVVPENNNVLIEPVGESSNLILAGDVEFFINTTYNPGKHQIVRGIVRAVPSELVYTTHPRHRSMPWDVDMELKVGDEVIYSYLSNWNSMDGNSGRQFLINGNFCITVPYDMIFVAKREGVIIPINGYVLVEPVKRKDRFGFSIATTKKTHDPQLGIVRHIGSKVRYYKYHGFGDHGDYLPGDFVVMEPVSDIPLEYKHRSTMGYYWKVQRKQILAKVEGVNVELYD